MYCAIASRILALKDECHSNNRTEWRQLYRVGVRNEIIDRLISRQDSKAEVYATTIAAKKEEGMGAPQPRTVNATPISCLLIPRI